MRDRTHMRGQFVGACRKCNRVSSLFLMGLVPDKFDSTDMLLPLVLLNSFLAATLVAFVVVVVIRVMKKA